ncbi:hypothetical protein QYE76_063577 [Lolium multiflorum]|uniref:Uncharacterized protein n=1 Tax=Lolium multiflorum TaxID=4521 RepID=A0AAD8S590_LOLMU|nr:hypothetical protein QYE76_063577 [Lolium multiflorum]
MALPATMKVLGVAVGLVSILVMGVLSEVTIELLVRFSARCRVLSYELVQGARRPARRAQMCVIINNAGSWWCTDIIGDVMSGSLKHAASWTTDGQLVLKSGQLDLAFSIWDLLVANLGSARFRICSRVERWQSGRATAK